MKKLLATTSLALLLPFTANADTVFGLKIGAGNWDHEPSGGIRYLDGGTGTSANLQNDLGLTKNGEGYSYIRLEHPIPIIPNIKVTNTSLLHAGSGTVTSDFTFGGTSYTASTATTSNIKLDHTDYTLYYELLDNVVSFDFGINIKSIDGSATINSDSVTFSGDIPMLYAAVELALPAGFSIGAEASSLSIKDSEITDITAKVSWTSDYFLGVEAGIRTINMKLDNLGGVYSDIKFDGMFIGAYFKF